MSSQEGTRAKECSRGQQPHQAHLPTSGRHLCNSAPWAPLQLVMMDMSYATHVALPPGRTICLKLSFAACSGIVSASCVGFHGSRAQLPVRHCFFTHLLRARKFMKQLSRCSENFQCKRLTSRNQMGAPEWGHLDTLGCTLGPCQASSKWGRLHQF